MLEHLASEKPHATWPLACCTSKAAGESRGEASLLLPAAKGSWGQQGMHEACGTTTGQRLLPLDTVTPICVTYLPPPLPAGLKV